MRIMIVDDEPASAEYISEIIKRRAAGSEVCAVAEDGEDALKKIKGALIDVVITDVAMPRMNGLKLVEALRRDYPSVKTIIVSGYQEFEYARTALRFGVTDYLLKPVNVGELVKCLEDMQKELSASKAPQTAGEGLFASLENYVTRHLSEQITLSSLCRHCGMSQTTANRVFRRSASMSFLEFLTQKRIARAREIMDANPKIMIKQVAAECGFCDPLYFSKVFKTYAGCAPSEYASRAYNKP